MFPEVGRLSQPWFQTGSLCGGYVHDVLFIALVLDTSKRLGEGDHAEDICCKFDELVRETNRTIGHGVLVHLQHEQRDQVIESGLPHFSHLSNRPWCIGQCFAQGTVLIPVERREQMRWAQYAGAIHG